MPIYEYRCEACGHLLDALQKISDEPLVDCPSCEKPLLKRLISKPSFRLKGSGWYETDFKSDKERKRNLAEAGGASDKASGDGAAKDDAKPPKSTEPKSETKTETKKANKAAAKGSGSEAA